MWVVSFDSKEAKEAALNGPWITIINCTVFLGDCENKVTIVKLYENPSELPDSVVIGSLCHYGKLFFFRQERERRGFLTAC